MTSKREREYARRRLEKYEQRQRERAAVAARRRRSAVIAAAVGAVVVVAAVVAFQLVDRGRASDTVAAAVSDEASTAASTTAPASEATSAAPVTSALCPDPAPGAVSDPVQLDEVPAKDDGAYTVTFGTSCGDVVATLDGAAAPQAVGNLVGLAEAGFYDGTPCHRLTTSGIFVLQCGDPTGTGQGGPGYSWGPIENAPADDVYPAGTLAMARIGGDGNSMGSQFFIVYDESTIPSDAAGGYTVMGSVTSGLDIVQKLAESGLGPDGIAPAQPIGIESVTVQEAS